MKKKLIEDFFYFLCVLAYFSLCIELPNLFNSLFNTDAFENTQFLFGSGLLVLMGFYFNYFSNKQSEKRNIAYQRLSKTIYLMNYLTSFDYKQLKVIQSAYYNEINDFHIIIKNTDIKVDNAFVDESILFDLDLRVLDQCLQNYNEEIEPFKISMHIKKTYKTN